MGPGFQLASALRRVAGAQAPLIGVDFDGTLAPFVDDPRQARAMPGSLEALTALAATGAVVAVVSGRDLETLRSVTGLTDEHGVELVGSHGAESSAPLGLEAPDADVVAQRLQEWTELLAQVVTRHPGSRLEHKQGGVAFHTRSMPDDDADAALADAAASAELAEGADVLRGKSVLELGAHPASKGAALLALADLRGAAPILYVGDDVTDERAFTALGADDVTIKVGDGTTAAKHRLPGIEQVVEVLQTLVKLRREAQSAP